MKKTAKSTKSSRAKHRVQMSNQKFVELVLKRQHKVIRVVYDAEKCKQDGWYREHTWTPAQKAGFREWFIEVAREKLGKTRKAAESMFSWWDMGYGWRDPSTSSSQAPS